jgi:hypothetical protein
MLLRPFHGLCFRLVAGVRGCRAGSRRASRPLRDLRSARVALARCGSSVRLRRRLAGWPRGLRRSSWRGVCGHRSRGLTPFPRSRSVVVHVHVHDLRASRRAQARARPWADERSLDVTTRPTRTAGWPTGAGVPRRAAVPRPHGPPRPARGLYCPPGPGVLAQPVVHPAAAHAARGHQLGDRRAVRPGAQ